MVDAWTKQVLENGSRNYVAIYNLLFTLTNHVTGYTAADPTSTGDMGVTIAGNTLYPGVHLKVIGLEYDISSGLGLQIQWNATANDEAVLINGQGGGERKFRERPLFPPASAGATGKLIFNTVGNAPAAGDLLSVTMWCRKGIWQ